MKEIIIEVITYIVSFIEISMYLKFMSVEFSSHMEYSGKLKLIVCLVMALITDLTNIINIEFCYGSMVNVLILLLMGHIIYSSSVIKEAMYTTSYLLIVYGIDVIMVSLFGVINRHEQVGGYFNIGLGIISKILLIIVVNIFVTTQKDKLKESTPDMNKVMAYGILASMVSMYALAFGLINLDKTVNSNVYIWIGMVTIALLINGIIIYYVIQKFSEGLIKQREYELVEYQNNLLTVATLEKNEANKEVRRMWHDFNNHIICVDMLLQMNNLEKERGYIKNLNASCNSMGIDIEIGNEIADIVVTQKIKVATENDIEIKVDGKFDKEVKVSQMDLCAILCNSLDNAIEACQKVNIGSRSIKIYFGNNEEYIYIDIINSMKDIKVENKSLITTKIDKHNHGIGMMSIKATIEKYKGDLEWSAEGSIFKLSMKLLNRNANDKKTKFENK